MNITGHEARSSVFPALCRRIRVVLGAFLATLFVIVGGGGCSTDDAPERATESTGGVGQALISASTKVCQLTGGSDRGRPSSPTGVALGGGTFGANATDIGYAFRDPYRNRLVFPFGDTHQFPTDRCEPSVCKTSSEAFPAGFEPPYERWASLGEWDTFVYDNGDGQENMATGPLGGFDPDECISLHVQTERRAWTFDHPISIASSSVAPAARLTGPKVAAGPQDKWVLAMGTRILVVTQDGNVFNHDVLNGQVGISYLLGQVPSYANDKAFVVLGNHIVAVRGTGHVDAYPVVGGSIQSGHRLGPMPGQTQPLVAITSDARQIFANPMTNQLLVATADGKVFFHNIDLVNYRIEIPYQLGTPGVLSGRLVVIGDASGGRLLDISANGAVRFHVLTSTSIGAAQSGSGASIAGRPQDRWVVAIGNHALVFTGEDVFRPSRLNGRPVGRKEGIFSGFADGATTYAFFTRRMWEPGCPDGQLEGCGHDEAGRGKTVLAFSTDGSNDFREIASFSSRLFLFPAPEVVQSVPASWNLPEMTGAPAVVVLGAGRESLTVPPRPEWHRSFPRLAIASLSTLWQRKSEVHVHDVNPSASVVFDQRELAIPSYGVAANPQDRWVIGRNGQILVIDDAGVVHVHPVNASNVGDQTALVGPPVGTSPRDRWVLAKGQDKLVIVRDDGLVYMQPVGATVGNGYQLGPAAGILPAVGNNPEDKWALVVGNSIVIVKRDGRVFKYDIVNDASLYPPREIATDAFKGVHNAGNIEHIVAVGNYIYSITNKGTVRASAVSFSSGWVASIGSAVAQSGSRVAWNPNDRWVIPVGSARLAVIPYFPQKWKYYGGVDGNGAPLWKTSEVEAVPLPPFGANGEYHKCLGYFSMRYVPSQSKWMMLYTCSGPPLGPGEQRGVYVRSAATPFGPWSAPYLIWRPDAAQGIGHCEFMFSRNPCGSGLNPREGSQRIGGDDDPNTAPGQLAWGNEYAPLLLPSEYFKPVGSSTDFSFYYAMSTWNPYQVVLMKSTGTLP